MTNVLMATLASFLTAAAAMIGVIVVIAIAYAIGVKTKLFDKAIYSITELKLNAVSHNIYHALNTINKALADEEFNEEMRTYVKSVIDMTTKAVSEYEEDLGLNTEKYSDEDAKQIGDYFN